MTNELYMSIPISGGEVVLGRESMNYQIVLDDFPKANQVRILTYNISKNQYKNELINALKSIKEDADVKIVSNIPSRMPTYFSTPAGDSMRRSYRNNFTAYLERLNPELLIEFMRSFSLLLLKNLHHILRMNLMFSGCLCLV